MINILNKIKNNATNYHGLIFKLFCLFFTSFSISHANLAIFEGPKINLPDDYKIDEPGRVLTAGWGYFIETNNSKTFTFLACYDRPACKNLNLTKYDLNWIINEFDNPTRLLAIQSFFPSFEKGLANDVSRENVDTEKLKAGNINYVKPTSYNSFTPRDFQSILLENKLGPWNVNFINVPKPSFFKKEKITISKEMTGCGCENIFENNGIEVQEKYTLDGFFYEKNRKLYFKELTKPSDILYYREIQPPEREVTAERDLIKEKKTYIENMTKFQLKIKKLEDGGIEIFKKYKCNPLAKFLLNQRIIILSKDPISIDDNKIKEINLCKMTLKKQKYLRYPDLKNAN